MKKVLASIAFVVLGLVSAHAQQVPLYSHYYYNQFLYNPALAGSQDYGQLYLINRNQWFSIPGAPRTQAVTLDGPLRSKKVGLGFGVYRDVAGMFNITGGSAAYRYSLELNNDQKLSFGIALGAINNRIDLSSVEVKNPNDQMLIERFQNTTGFDANMGVNYTIGELNIGVSVPQIIGNELAYEAVKSAIVTNTARYGLARHFIANVSYKWDMKDNETWYLQPNAIVRVTPNAPTQFDISAMLNYKDKYWLGGMYRSAYAVTAAAGMRLADQFVAGYAYDVAIHADLNQYTRGAHEVMLGYQFGGSPADHPDIKKKFKEVDDKITAGEEKVDSLAGEVKKNREDIDENTEDINDNDSEIEEIKSKIKSFEQFIEDFRNGKEKPKSIGEIYTFQNVYFETNKWDVRTEARGELDNLVTILKDNPRLKIEVAGHADQRGSASYNKWLSNKRANAVRDYLIKNGANAEQLEIKGYGEDTSFEELDKNRRVEFKILAE